MPYYHCVIGSGGGGGTSGDAVIEGTATVVTSATKIKKYVFSYDTALESLTAPNVTEIGTSAIRNTTNLQTLVLGALTSIGDTALYSAGKTGSTFDIVLNNATVSTQALQASKVRYITGTWASASGSCLRGCTSLKKLEFNLNKLPTYFLNGDTALEEIYLSYDQAVVTLDGNNCLTNVPSTCKVYVPSALVTSYQADSNWSRFDIQSLPS